LLSDLVKLTCELNLRLCPIGFIIESIVLKGEYTSGPREGEPSVCKWFKSGSVYETTFFDLDIKAVDKAVKIIRAFNQGGFVNKTIRMNIPQVWTCQVQDYSEWSGRKTLVEPFIHNWEKFNSNSGWASNKGGWHEVMQALSHFSYHCSGGQFVLCDLQGGVYQDGVVLTDPVILSRSRSYGVTDLGSDGITSFFARHRCNSYCRSSWSKPRSPSATLPLRKGTTMQHVSTRHSRMLMTFPGKIESSDDYSSDDYY